MRLSLILLGAATAVVAFPILQSRDPDIPGQTNKGQSNPKQGAVTPTVLSAIGVGALVAAVKGPEWVEAWKNSRAANRPSDIPPDALVAPKVEPTRPMTPEDLLVVPPGGSFWKTLEGEEKEAFENCIRSMGGPVRDNWYMIDNEREQECKWMILQWRDAKKASPKSKEQPEGKPVEDPTEETDSSQFSIPDMGKLDGQSLSNAAAGVATGVGSIWGMDWLAKNGLPGITQGFQPE